MAELYHKDDTPQLICIDRNYYHTIEDQLEALKDSRTLYVGNLSFYTTETQILETFSLVGPVKRVIMGLNAQTKTPCGFCFVEYYNKEHSDAALKYVTETVCDERIIRCDADGGFKPGRQFGRGKSGGQRRDDRFQNKSDVHRGGGIVQPFQKKHKRDYDDGDRDERNVARKIQHGLQASR